MDKDTINISKDFVHILLENLCCKFGLKEPKSNVIRLEMFKWDSELIKYKYSLLGWQIR